MVFESAVNKRWVNRGRRDAAMAMGWVMRIWR